MISSYSKIQNKCFMAAHQICISLNKLEPAQLQNQLFCVGTSYNLEGKSSCYCLICGDFLCFTTSMCPLEEREIFYQHMLIHVNKLKAFI